MTSFMTNSLWFEASSAQAKKLQPRVLQDLVTAMQSPIEILRSWEPPKMWELQQSMDLGCENARSHLGPNQAELPFAMHQFGFSAVSKSQTKKGLPLLGPSFCVTRLAEGTPHGHGGP